MYPLTELDAVNIMLDAIGNTPVTSIDPAPNPLITKARLTLGQVTTEVQLRGWHFNTDDGVFLSRDTVALTVAVPSNVLRLAPSGTWASYDVVQRANKLWDRVRQSWQFTFDIPLDIVWLLDFGDMPPAARNYVALKAARRFQERVMGDPTLGKFQQGDEIDALNMLNEAEMATGAYNMINGNASVWRVVNRSPSSPSFNSLGSTGLTGSSSGPDEFDIVTLG